MTEADTIPREVLPIPDRQHVGLTTYDAKDPDTKYPPIEPLRPPKGAPNVLIVLIDDVGFGASSAFGGPCHTPTAERLAKNGLKYNRFHTTALCSPTRQALLTGRNHHTVGMGGITEMATSAPGNCSIRPKSCAPLAQTLKLNGYGGDAHCQARRFDRVERDRRLFPWLGRGRRLNRGRGPGGEAQDSTAATNQAGQAGNAIRSEDTRAYGQEGERPPGPFRARASTCARRSRCAKARALQ